MFDQVEEGERTEDSGQWVVITLLRQGFGGQGGQWSAVSEQ